MQYPYVVQNLIPLSVRYDEEGQAYEVYNLPAPKNWQFRTYTVNDTLDIGLHTVTKIRLSLFSEEDTHKAVVVPFNEQDKEDIRGTIVFEDVYSVPDVLEKMGFVAIDSPVPFMNFHPCNGNG